MGVADNALAVEADSSTLLSCSEGESLHVPWDASSLRRAWYGAPGHQWGAGPDGADVTEIVQGMLSTSPTLTATNASFGDPAPGVYKVLCLERDKPAELPHFSLGA